MNLKKKKKNLKTSIKVDEQIYLVVTASKNTGKNYSMKYNITEVFDTLSADFNSLYC